MSEHNKHDPEQTDIFTSQMVELSRGGLKEAGRLWLQSGLERWFQGQLDKMVGAPDPTDEGLMLAIPQIKIDEKIQLAKVAESPVLAEVDWTKNDPESPNKLHILFMRFQVSDSLLNDPLVHVPSTITRNAEGEAIVETPWDTPGEGTPISPEAAYCLGELLAVPVLSLARIDQVAQDTPEERAAWDQFETEQIRSAQDFLASIQ